MEWFDSRIELNMTDLDVASNRSLDGPPLVTVQSFMDTIWYPDLYVLNSRKVTFPKLTKKPKFLGFHGSGKVSSNILTKAIVGCPMNYIKYPVCTHLMSLSFSNAHELIKTHKGWCSTLYSWLWKLVLHGKPNDSELEQKSHLDQSRNKSHFE